MATETRAAHGVIVDDARNLPRLLRKKTVLAMVGGVADSTVFRWEQSGRFPRRIRISSRLTVWRAEEVEAWLECRRAS